MSRRCGRLRGSTDTEARNAVKDIKQRSEKHLGQGNHRYAPQQHMIAIPQTMRRSSGRGKLLWKSMEANTANKPP
jgi:hypothetical protein